MVLTWLAFPGVMVGMPLNREGEPNVNVQEIGGIQASFSCSHISIKTAFQQAESEGVKHRLRSVSRFRFPGGAYRDGNGKRVSGSGNLTATANRRQSTGMEGETSRGDAEGVEEGCA